MDKSKNINVLYVDDEIRSLEGFKANFRRLYNIYVANSAKEARKILETTEIQVLVSDHKMPETSGTQLIEESVNKYPHQTRILLTAYADKEAIMSAMNRGLIFRHVLKPYIPEELKQIIDLAYQYYQLKKTKESLYHEWLDTQQQLKILEKRE